MQSRDQEVEKPERIDASRKRRVLQLPNVEEDDDGKKSMEGPGSQPKLKRCLSYSCLAV